MFKKIYIFLSKLACKNTHITVPSVVPSFNALFCLSVVSIFVFIECCFSFLVYCMVNVEQPWVDATCIAPPYI